MTTLGQKGRFGLLIGLLILMLFGISLRAGAAPYAAMVIDARSGEVLHSRNADTRLHPASLTKMMTLYIAFQAVEHGEVTLDTKFLISKKAAAEPPSKIGLRAGQRVALRYLIRAASVKSANDAATAIGEGLEGSEAAFARRMTRTAEALGMSRTTFKNAHGLTENGHMSTARDMTTLGRHLFYDYPEYYNLFSRMSTSTMGKTVYNTNRRFLGSYKGADGIKTGYTRAAGFNLVSSAQRGQERVIATVFGGRSSAARNAKIAELLDLGFRRAPTRVAVRKPRKPAYVKGGGNAPVAMATLESPSKAPQSGDGIYKGKTIRLQRAVLKSIRPMRRPGADEPAVSEELLLALSVEIDDVVKTEAAKAAETKAVEQVVLASVQPLARPQDEEQTIPGSAGDLEMAIREESGGFTATGGPALARVLVPKRRPQRSEPVLASAKPIKEVSAAPVQFAAAHAATAPMPRTTIEPAPEQPRVITRVSTSGGKHWGISLGKYTSRYKAERVLLKTALKEMETLDGSLRKVANRKGGFEATFLGLSAEQAQNACARLSARGTECRTMEPGNG